VVTGTADGGWWGLVCELVKRCESRVEAVCDDLATSLVRP
jgi:hypothetical protein